MRGDQPEYELVTAYCCTLYEVNTHVLPETPSERSVVGAESRLLELALISSLVGEDTPATPPRSSSLALGVLDLAAATGAGLLLFTCNCGR